MNSSSTTTGHFYYSTIKPRITSPEERYFWTLYNLVVAVCSLVGDTTILVGTTRWKAIKLHRVIVVVIQHLAVCDLLLTFVHVIPTVVSLIADTWVFGRFLCHLQETVDWLCFPMTGALTCVMTLSKLVIVKCPLRTGMWTRRSAHMVCTLIWVLNLFSPIHTIHIFFTDKDTAYFSFVSYSCNFNLPQTHAPTWLIMTQEISSLVSLAVIFIILPVSSTLLLLEARKTAMRQHTHLRWQGVVTVVMTTAVFIISWFPNLVVGVTTLTLQKHYNISTWRTTQFLLNLNIMANFFIYCLTVPSFRECLRDKLRGALHSITHVGLRVFRMMFGRGRRSSHLPNVVWKQLQNIDQLHSIEQSRDNVVQERQVEGGIEQRHSQSIELSDRHSTEMSDGRSNSNYTELSLNTP